MRTLLVLCLLASCGTTAGNAALAVGLGAAAAGVSRAEGGCYAVCTHGTACDTSTGYCEPIKKACTLDCADTEFCQHEATGDRCVALDMSGSIQQAPIDPADDPADDRQGDPPAPGLFPVRLGP